MTRDLSAVLAAAVHANGAPSSDYDLNPQVDLPPTRKLREAAVLIPVIDRASGPTVMLTKRTSTLKHHPGQIAFPGGKVDETDDGVVAAALREAEEEVGLGATDVEVVGTLPCHETVTSFSVTPVLALVAPFRAKPQAGEVAEAFEVPLAHLIEPSNYSVQSRRWRGARRAYFTVPFGPYYIWGATARMLRALADRMEHAD
ncbi:MAG: CoA pyrophosphatase [Pseudomonadota bacterium]